MNLEDKILEYAYQGADNWSKTLSIPTLVIDYVTLNGYLGVIPSMTVRTIKKLPKLTILTYESLRTGKKINYAKAVVYEALTTIPFIGEILEWRPFRRKKHKKKKKT